MILFTNFFSSAVEHSQPLTKEFFMCQVNHLSCNLIQEDINKLNMKTIHYDQGLQNGSGKTWMKLMVHVSLFLFALGASGNTPLTLGNGRVSNVTGVNGACVQSTTNG